MRAPGYLMRQKVSIREYLGESGYSGPIYKDPYVQRCRVEYKRRLIRSAEDEDAITEAHFVFPHDQKVVPVGSIIDFDGLEFRVKENQPIYALSRLSYLEVIAGV